MVLPASESERLVKVVILSWGRLEHGRSGVDLDSDDVLLRAVRDKCRRCLDHLAAESNVQVTVH